ncbi:MAG: PsiF family protein [Gallionella sp.]|nr:PsiF family protein [Gallionella sp.]MDD4958836.1 PsiF family protein [Gallionella sp.]
MKKLIALACLGFALAASSSAFAGPQQEKMKGCNIEAKASALKGEERKAFMKKCLSKEYVLKAGTAKPAAAKPATGAAAPAAAPVASSAVAAAAVGHAAAAGKQQNKMKTCNEEIKTKKLKGEERRTFMATCLKG